jgi:hypothetical protein
MEGFRLLSRRAPSVHSPNSLWMKMTLMASDCSTERCLGCGGGGALNLWRVDCFVRSSTPFVDGLWAGGTSTLVNLRRQILIRCRCVYP